MIYDNMDANIATHTHTHTCIAAKSAKSYHFVILQKDLTFLTRSNFHCLVSRGFWPITFQWKIIHLGNNVAYIFFKNHRSNYFILIRKLNHCVNNMFLHNMSMIDDNRKKLYLDKWIFLTDVLHSFLLKRRQRN